MTAGLKSGPEPAAAARPDPDVTVFDLMTPLIRRWKLIAGTALTLGILAAIVLLLQRPTFTARITFTPETPTTPSSAGLSTLAGVANQLGLNLTPTSSVSPDFFVKLTSSAEVLRSALLTEFPDPRDPEKTPKPLLDIIEVKGKTLEERLQRGVIQLRKRLDATADKPTGVVAIEVDMRHPELAAAVANHLVQLLNKFNLERRQSQSREQRRFTGERLEEAEKELRAAEQAHLAFLQRNRDYSSSPLLTFEANRLTRDVQVKQALFLTLSNAHTEARIAEVRDTPVLTVIDSAVAPFRRSRPKRTLGVLLALSGGTLLGIGIAYVVDFRKRAASEQKPDYLAMRDAWAEARRELSRTPGDRP
jgi:tyrosine-protein kinase Etk/Wzc